MLYDVFDTTYSMLTKIELFKSALLGQEQTGFLLKF